MTNQDWRTRLAAAIDADGRSMREICKAAGLRPNFLTQLFNENKEPKILNFMKLCQGLKVSPLFILMGIQSDPEGEEFLRLWVLSSPARRKALRDLLDAD